MKISVLLPVYNEGPYIEQCIQSVLAQDGVDFEICISDNASTDDTWDIIQWYKSSDSRIVAIRQSIMIHPWDNLNAALQLASGGYVFWLGGDDFVLPHMFSDIASLLRGQLKPSLVCVRMHYFSDIDGRVLTTVPPVNFEGHINGSIDGLLRFFLHNINHDQLIIGFFSRVHFVRVMKLFSHYALEPLGMWAFFALALSATGGDVRARIPERVYYMKRNNKVLRQDSSYHRSEAMLAKRSALRGYFAKVKGSFENIISLYKSNLLSFRQALFMAFAFRYHDPYGLWGTGPIIDPFYRVIAKVIRRFSRNQE